MSEERINTARTNEILQLDHLTAEQRHAVAKLRIFVEAQGTSAYAVAAVCQRNQLLLERMESGKRWAKLSPASRELLIADIREMLSPHEPELVVVWSHWAEANDVECSLLDDPPSLVLVPDIELSRPSGEAALTAYARAYNCTVITVARWCEMKRGTTGYLYGATVMPDRESDYGIHIAQIIFEACIPASPEAVAHRIARRK